MNQLPQYFSEQEKETILRVSSKSKRRKLWRRFKREHEMRAREEEYRIRHPKVKKKTHRAPYYLRGRRKRYWRCNVCGEYLPKRVRVIKVKNKEGEWRYKPQFYVICEHHGETVCDINKSRWFKWKTKG